MTRFSFFVALFLFQRALLTAQSSDVKTLDPLLSNYKYPFEVKFFEVHTQGDQQRMAYMNIEPENTNGRTVVLLHGKNFNGAYWAETARALAKEGFRLIIPDQVGFGKSTKPRHYQYTFQQLALNTKKLLDSLNVDEAVIVGHSMGGMLACRFALMFPETTEKLVLVNPIGLEDWKLKVPYQPIEKWFASELKQDYASIKKYQLQNYYDNEWRPEYDEWVNIQAGLSQHHNYPLIAWNSALTYDMIFTQPVLYEFSEIESPTLLIIGQRDRTALGKNFVSEDVKKTMGNYPKLGKQAEEKIRNAKLVELDNVGHLPHIEAFDRFIKPVLDFLNEDTAHKG